MVAASFFIICCWLSTIVSSFEVIGHRGTIGSFFSKHKNAVTVNDISQVDLGRGKMIIAAVPSSSVKSVIAATPESRKSDLVFVANGLIGFDETPDATLAILFFGVNPQLIVSKTQPFTAVHGKYSQQFAEVCESFSIPCEVIASPTDFILKQFAKQIWSSAYWLLCAASSSCTIGEVNFDDESRLIKELISSGESRLGKKFDELERKRICEDVSNYAAIMGNVTPSKALAMKELSGRNGWFLASKGSSNKLHRQLLDSVGVDVEKIVK